MNKPIDLMNDEELEEVESNIVDALLDAAAYRTGDDKKRIVNIKRNGRTLFKFTIEPLTEDEWRKCRRQNTANKRNAELNDSRFLAQAIYEATVEEDKRRIWQNKEIWEKLNVATGTDVVNIVLTPGEKAKITEVLSEISGYDDDLDGMIQSL